MRTLLLGALLALLFPFSGVTAEPRQPEAPLLLRIFRIQSGLIGGAPGMDVKEAPYLILDEAPRKRDGSLSATDFLAQKGVTFPPGSSASYIRHASVLVVKNTAENLHRAARLIEIEDPFSKFNTIVQCEARLVEFPPAAKNLLTAGLTYADVAHNLDNLGAVLKTVTVASATTQSGQWVSVQTGTVDVAGVAESPTVPQSEFGIEPVKDVSGKTVYGHYEFTYAAPVGADQPALRLTSSGDFALNDGKFVLAKTFTVPVRGNEKPPRHYALYLSVRFLDPSGLPAKRAEVPAIPKK